MLRRTQLKRGTTPLKRTPLPPRTSFIAKTGRVGKRKQAFRDRAKAHYFEQHGEKKLGAKTVTAPCQLCGLDMKKTGAHTHHKKPRGEGGADTFENSVVLHARCHMVKVHGRQFGRPSATTKAGIIFKAVELHTANIINGQVIAPIDKES